ncbi:MAG TPA: phasin family protein [Casimicrobiaceae bacterium]|nr:phasin family protein [Casimicrobiaceae bacterium]
MLDSIQSRAAVAGDAFLNTSRQMWLAGLGAAVVTREWAGKEAVNRFRALVREGTAVESRTFRFVGDRLDTSFTRANRMWQQARRTVSSTAKQVAGTAATLVRSTMPSKPASVVPRKTRAPKRVVKRTRKAASPRKPVKRVAKRPVKRG